jgi:hypothetical protein
VKKLKQSNKARWSATVMRLRENLGVGRGSNSRCPVKRTRYLMQHFKWETRCKKKEGTGNQARLDRGEGMGFRCAIDRQKNAP